MALFRIRAISENGLMTTSHERTRTIRDRLVGATQRVTDLLRGEPTGDWHGRYREAVYSLAEAYADHVDEAESPGGLLLDITEADPRLDVEVATLRRDHTELAERFQQLLATEREPAGLLEDTAELLLDLEAHEKLSADLVYRAFSEDLGDAG